MNELPKAYDPSQVEAKWYRVWTEQGYFHADEKTPKTPFSIVIRGHDEFKEEPCTT